MRDTTPPKADVAVEKGDAGDSNPKPEPRAKAKEDEPKAREPAKDKKSKGNAPKPEYVFSFAFGDKGTGDGQFNTPMGVAIAPSGNIIVADTSNNRVQVFEPTGKFLKKFGKEHAIFLAKDVGSGKGNFWFPRAVAVSSAGEIVVTEALNNRVQVFDPEATFLRMFGNKGRGNGNFDGPSGVAITAAGGIVVADEKNHRVQMLDKEGKFVDQFGNQGAGDGQFLTGIWDVAITPSEDFVVSDCRWVQVFDKKGKFQRKFGEPPADSFTTGVAVLPSDQIAVAYMGKFTGIRVFDLEGKLLTEFGGQGPGNGQFNEPSGVAVDRSGNIFVADKANHRIQVFKRVEK